MKAHPGTRMLLALIVGAALVVLGGVTPRPAYAAIFTVNSTADTADAEHNGICDDGAGNCTLRAAIQEASVGGADINFNIPGSDPRCDPGTRLCTIAPTSALPTITEAVTIDGTTQPGAGYIELGAVGLDAPGLHITASNSTVRGLIIRGFNGSGIVLETGSGNLIQNNVIGKGPGLSPEVGNGDYGVRIIASSNNTVGDPSPTGVVGNTLSGNGTGGVLIEGTGSVGNVVQANNIGLDLDVTSPLGNGGNGVTVTDAKNTTIARNTISANGGSGVYISGAEATGNVLTGNIIGADVTGTLDRGNAQDGVRIDGAPDNSVGVPSSDPLTGNLISGNDGAGVHISGAGAEGNKVQHNGIGVQLDLKSPLGNGSHGVWIEGSSNNNLVGGTALIPPTPPPANPPSPPNPWVVPYTLNTIAYNGGAGVYVDGTGNSIRANNIYDNGSLGIDVSWIPPGQSSPFRDRKVTSALWSATRFWVDKDKDGVIDPDEWVPFPLVIATGYIHGGWANTGVVVEGFISSQPDQGEKWEAGGDSVPDNVPPPFYIDADGNMSAAGSFRSADAVGKYFTDTVTNVQDGHPQKGTTLEFSNAVQIGADQDGDGIEDGIDSDDHGTAFSNLFSDGITSGDLIGGGADGRNNCLVSVVGLGQTQGVVLGATCLANSDGTLGPAHLTVCGGRPVDLPTATSTIVKCGSADFSVGYGPVFVGVGTMQARMPTEAEVVFNNPHGITQIVKNNSASATIWVGGDLILPGLSALEGDFDGDGMADAYELAHKDCLQWTVKDADQDPDHDGVDNISEAVAGTDPCVANSVSTPTATPTPTYTPTATPTATPTPAPTPAPLETHGATIGSGGGTVLADSVSSSDPVDSSVVVPPGALADDTDITITEFSDTDPGLPPPPAGSLPRVLRFGPEGTAFTEDVTMVLSYDDSAVPGGVNEADLLVKLLVSGSYVTLGDCSSTNPPVPDPCVLARDTSANTITISTRHFSIYALSAPAAVGGIAELPDLAGASAEEAGASAGGSGWSSDTYAALVGGIAAAAVVLSAGAWYARRRWLR